MGVTPFEGLADLPDLGVHVVADAEVLGDRLAWRGIFLTCRTLFMCGRPDAASGIILGPDSLLNS